MGWPPTRSASERADGDIHSGDSRTAGIGLDAERIGLVGHSFGRWTVLATPEVEPQVRAVVAMGPGGSTHPRPGILPLKLTFTWGRDDLRVIQRTDGVPVSGQMPAKERGRPTVPAGVV